MRKWLLTLATLALAGVNIPFWLNRIPLPPASEPEAPAKPVDYQAKPIVYPYSVVEGGVASARELEDAAKRDGVVAEHYRGFDYHKAKLLTVKEDRQAYVSYRKDNRIYWTRKKVTLRRGEVLLTDGKITARGRCGNQVCDSPREPVEAAEPPEIATGQPEHQTPDLRLLTPWQESRPSFLLASGTWAASGTSAEGTPPFGVMMGGRTPASGGAGGHGAGGGGGPGGKGAGGGGEATPDAGRADSGSQADESPTSPADTTDIVFPRPNPARTSLPAGQASSFPLPLPGTPAGGPEIVEFPAGPPMVRGPFATPRPPYVPPGGRDPAPEPHPGGPFVEDPSPLPPLPKVPGTPPGTPPLPPPPGNPPGSPFPPWTPLPPDSPLPPGINSMVPEPASFLLSGASLLVLGLVLWRRVGDNGFSHDGTQPAYIPGRGTHHGGGRART